MLINCANRICELFSSFVFIRDSLGNQISQAPQLICDLGPAIEFYIPLNPVCIEASQIHVCPPKSLFETALSRECALEPCSPEHFGPKCGVLMRYIFVDEFVPVQSLSLIFCEE